VRGRAIIAAALVVLLAALWPAASEGTSIQLAKFEGFATEFKLEGSNGYDIWVSAYAPRRDGKGWISFAVAGRNAAAFYRAPALVEGEAARDTLATVVKADLGSLGRVDLILNRSRREATFRWPCGGPEETYEPGLYEGTLEFKGEGGYTRATATAIPFAPSAFFFLAGGCGGSGSGESLGPGIPGARLKGLSFGHDRILTFQVNKNGPTAKTIYSASVRERHDGIFIHREVDGTAGPGAFRFDRDLETATLSASAPFSGSATLRRSHDSLLPRWRGDLKIAFPGHTIPLAGPSVHVSLMHAHRTESGSSHAEAGF